MPPTAEKTKSLLSDATARREELFAAVTILNDHMSALSVQEFGAAEICVQQLDKLEEQFSLADSSVVQLNSQLPEGDRDSSPSKYSAFFTVALTIRKHYGNLARAQPVPTAPATPAPNLPLPNITLPTFNGQIDRWPEFIALFDALVHTNSSLQDIQKLHFLRASISGEAAAVVAGFELTAPNYLLAYDALQCRFQNNRRLALMYLDQILQFPRPSDLSLNHLKEFVIRHKNAIHALRALPIPDLADFLLCSLTLQNLSKPLRQQFESQVSSNSFPTLEMLLQFATQQLRVLESTTSLSSNKVRPHAQPSSQTVWSSPKSPSGSFKSTRPASPLRESSPHHRPVYSAAKPSTSSAQFRIVCAYCDAKDHSIRQCRDFKALNVHQRRSYVENTNLCRNCLSSYHLVHQCGSTQRCHTCSKPHHTILHLSSNAPPAPQDVPARSPSCSLPPNLSSSSAAPTIPSEHSRFTYHSSSEHPDAPSPVPKPQRHRPRTSSPSSGEQSD